MILYSKSGDFLGIGKDELSFLGYEDLDEFKSIHNDVADLFVNKPGYIFKFKNFSWIDYALHSGAPKKSVIIKLKTGNEVEVSIKIKELFLYNQKKDEEIYYSVEFLNSMSQNNSLQSGTSFIQSTPAPQVSSLMTIDKEPSVEEIIPVEETSKDISFESDFIQEETTDFSVDFNTSEVTTPTPKLKVDGTLLENEVKTVIKISDDYVSEETPKLKIDIEPEEYSFKPNIEISDDYKEDVKKELLTIETPTILDIKEEEENINFDLVECVEELGLDISLVGQLITDYMDNIDRNIPIIKSSIEEKDEVLLENSIYILKGISDNLHMIQLSSRLEKILKATDIKSKMEELEKFEKIVIKFKGELI